MLSFILTLKRLLTAVFRAIKKPVFISLFVTLLLIITSGTLFFHSTEQWSWLDSIYFSVVSLIPTSVDIGLTPTQNLSKIFLMLYLAVGVGVMLMLLITLGKAVVDFENIEKKARERRGKLK